MARLNDEEIEERLTGAEGWERDGDAIRRQYELDDFKGSADFVNRLTPEAEGMNHHPDLEISWNKVTVRISTHSEGGLTDSDFELARKIDARPDVAAYLLPSPGRPMSDDDDPRSSTPTAQHGLT